MPGVGVEWEVVHFGVADRDAGRVVGGVEFSGDLQPGGCGGLECVKFSGHLVGDFCYAAVAAWWNSVSASNGVR